MAKSHPRGRRKPIILLPSLPQKPNHARSKSPEVRARLLAIKKMLRAEGLTLQEARYVVAHSFPGYTVKPFDSMTQADIERRLEMVREIQFARTHQLEKIAGARGNAHRARLQLFYDILHHSNFSPNMIKDRLIGLANRLAETTNEKEQLELIAKFRHDWMGN